MTPEDYRPPDDRIDERLDRLAEFATHSPFSQLYCRLLTAWCREAGNEAAPLTDAIVAFLDGELWYHSRLTDLSERETMAAGDLRSLADKRRIRLSALTERLHQIEAAGPRATVLWHLLLAECHYQLHETGGVVKELEAAIAEGGGHPLIYFALGYKRLEAARQRYSVEATGESGSGRLEEGFRRRCMEAVDAFREGLTGQTFDAWLHLYIGRALAAAGQIDEASAALETAARIDSSILAQPSLVDGPTLDLSEIGLQQEPEQDGDSPITDDEVREFSELLGSRSWSLEDLED